MSRSALAFASLALAPVLAGAAALGFENTKVLPQGVRNLNVRAVDTVIGEKTNGAGDPRPLGEPLAKHLTFAKIAKDEEPHRANELRAFLLENGFTEADAVGVFSSDLNGRVSVLASIFSYGVSANVSLAVGVPYYRANTKVAVGFKQNDTARAFLAKLQEPHTNESASAREAAAKLNNAVGRLNDKLERNGYRALRDWEDAGVGDVTIGAKHRFLANTVMASSYTVGLILPTGRKDDPNILTDVGFGDGQTDSFVQVGLDETPIKDVTFNQYAQYTVQFPGRKLVRAKTADEEIDVSLKDTRYKLGDKIDAGLSAQYQPRHGLVTGVGYKYFRKYGDVYGEVESLERAELEKETDQSAHNGEARLGYSTVPLYQSGAFAVPFELILSYTRQLQSQNMPVSDLAQLDMNLFF